MHQRDAVITVVDTNCVSRSITHSSSLADEGNSIACGTGNNLYSRTFDLSDFGVSSNLTVESVSMGLSSGASNAAFTLNLYKLTKGVSGWNAGSRKYGNIEF